MTVVPPFPGREFSIIRSSLMVLAMALVSTGVMGQNQVSNSNLNGSMAPWLAEGSLPPNPIASGTATWTDQVNDGNGISGSGSVDTVLAGLPSQGANAAFGIRQCIQLPGAPLGVSEANYTASFLAPTSNPSDGLARMTVEVRFFSDSDCTLFIPGAGGSQGYELRAASLSDTVWYEIGDAAYYPSAGSITASSALVRVFIRTVATTDSSYRVYLDHIILSLNGTVAVELNSFTID